MVDKRHLFRFMAMILAFWLLFMCYPAYTDKEQSAYVPSNETYDSETNDSNSNHSNTTTEQINIPSNDADDAYTITLEDTSDDVQSEPLEISSIQEDPNVDLQDNESMQGNKDTKGNEATQTSDTTQDSQVTNNFVLSPFSLMQITLDDNIDTVVQIHGEPVETYEMAHDTDPIQVYRYAHHTVGFDSSNQVVFVDVTSELANTGLNGVTLGSTNEQVFTALGQPSYQTEYVISYFSDNAIIKMDYDPATHTILSIKLFAQ